MSTQIRCQRLLRAHVKAEVLQRAHSAQAAKQHPHLLQRRLLYQNRKDDADPMGPITVHVLAEVLQRMPMAPKTPIAPAAAPAAPAQTH